MVKWRAFRLLIFVPFLVGATVAVAIGTANPPDVIQMKSPYEHTRGIVALSHQKHAADYKVSCGECHHDDKGQPLKQLKTGDPVKKCFDCHKKPGEIKGKEAKGLTDKEKRAYHANAVHDNCIECHKQFNKGKEKKSAPQTCKECHGGKD